MAWIGTWCILKNVTLCCKFASKCVTWSLISWPHITRDRNLQVEICTDSLTDIATKTSFLFRCMSFEQEKENFV